MLSSLSRLATLQMFVSLRLWPTGCEITTKNLILYTVHPQYLTLSDRDTHYFLRTDSLNKALCQSAASLFVVVGYGSIVSENSISSFSEKMILAPAVTNPVWRCDRERGKFLLYNRHRVFLLDQNANSMLVQTDKGLGVESLAVSSRF